MHDSYESVTEGEQFDLGSYTLEREEMLSFAQSYDPQSYHLDEDDDSMFDGVVASGWQTAALTMRLLVDGYLTEAAVLGSPGLDKLRWPTPVTAGDTLSATLTIGETEIYDESRGLVHQEVETTNQDDQTVLWMDALALYRRE